MSFKRDNKKIKNIALIAGLVLIAAAYLFINNLPDQTSVSKITKGYDLNAKF
jgi:hypothetical protein